jgi:hypothetical protein
MSVQRAEFLRALSLAIESTTDEARLRLFQSWRAFGPEISSTLPGDALSSLLDFCDTIDEGLLWDNLISDRKALQ